MESHKYDWHLRMTKETMGVESQTASGLREKFGSRKGLDYTRIFKHAPRDCYSSAHGVLFSNKTQLWPYKGERAGVGWRWGMQGRGKKTEEIHNRKEGTGKVLGFRIVNYCSHQVPYC